jgi:hypothetical protein
MKFRQFGTSGGSVSLTKPWRKNRMRVGSLLITLAFVSLLSSPAKADPYRWCAEYGGGMFGGGHTSCYFRTFEQCRESVSGVGGFCRQNAFYDGRPVTTPEDRPVRRPRKHT